MFKGQVVVTLKKSILDPQGSAVEKALHTMSYKVNGVRIGKYMEVEIDEDDQEKAVQALDEICRKVLTNPVIEEYTFVLLNEAGQVIGGAR